MSWRRPEALYGALLGLFPRVFRERHGAGMRQVFLEQYTRAAAGGRTTRLRFLCGSVADTTRSAALERVASWRDGLLFPGRQLSNQRGQTLMHALLTDLRHAWRVFSRAPKGTTALAVLTLALGIGANAAMFTVIYNVLIEPLPYPASDRVFIGWETNPKLGDVSISPSMANALQWRTSSSVESVALYSGRSMVFAAAEPEALDVVRGDAELLTFMGVRPTIGRSFTPIETTSDAAGRVALLSHALWTLRFGASHSVLGRRIELDDESYEVIGVLPDSFRLPLTETDVLLPLLPPPPPAKGKPLARTSVSTLVRVKPSVVRHVAEAELSALTAPASGPPSPWRVRLMPPRDMSGPTFQRTLYILFGAVGCVLLIACANVAHLVLARNASRRREIAVRVALGASRGRLARQLLFESLLLALLGAAAGLAIGLWGVQAISALRPPQLRQLAAIRINGEVFVFASLLALATGLLFGLLPAIAAARGASPNALKQGGAAMSGRRGTFGRRAITVAEVALALVLLTGAGLLLRSYARVLTTDRGFRADGLVTVTLQLPETRYPTRKAQATFMRNAATEMAGVPGVGRVLIASGVPPAGGLIFGELEIEGLEKAPGGAAFGGGFVEPGFFEALRIPVREGRTFTSTDLESDSVIVNERTARRYWPGESALGKRLRLGSDDSWDTIIGVVGDVDMDHGEVGNAQLYFPLGDPAMAGESTLLVASTIAPSDLIPALKARIWTLDPRLALDDVESIEQAVRNVTARPRFNVVLLSVFASLGLVLAMVGVYGVVSYSVGLRTREIGVRMALGAVPTSIARSIVSEALALAAIGVVLGLAAAVAGAQLMRRLLFEISPNDPVTLGGVALLLAGTAVVASLIPARRAMRVDPIVALRME